MTSTQIQALHISEAGSAFYSEVVPGFKNECIIQCAKQTATQLCYASHFFPSQMTMGATKL